MVKFSFLTIFIIISYFYLSSLRKVRERLKIDMDISEGWWEVYQCSNTGFSEEGRR